MLYPKINLQKIKPLPERLIYKRAVHSAMYPIQEEFVIFSTKSKKETAFMVCHETTYPIREDYKGKSLAIDYIVSTPSQRGMGRDLIKFAKNYSKERGCNGYIFLKADSSLQPWKVPHLFYRKCGFSTLNPKIDKKIDKFISENKNATRKDFRCDLMYYPPRQSDGKSSITDKLKIFFRRLFVE